MSSQQITWPNLPTEGFVSGRSASPADVERGDAVFSTNGAGRLSPITVRQYAYWRDEWDVKHPRIIVQAEEAPGGLTIVGMRDLLGAASAATLSEMEILGVKKPN